MIKKNMACFFLDIVVVFPESTGLSFVLPEIRRRATGSHAPSHLLLTRNIETTYREYKILKTFPKVNAKNLLNLDGMRNVFNADQKTILKCCANFSIKGQLLKSNLIGAFNCVCSTDSTRYNAD